LLSRRRTGKLSRMRLAGPEDELRATMFSWLDRHRSLYGDRIPWKVLQSFEYDGHRAALITQRGIHWLSGRPACSRSFRCLAE